MDTDDESDDERSKTRTVLQDWLLSATGQTTETNMVSFEGGLLATSTDIGFSAVFAPLFYGFMRSQAEEPPQGGLFIRD